MQGPDPSQAFGDQQPPSEPPTPPPSGAPYPPYYPQAAQPVATGPAPLAPEPRPRSDHAWVWWLLGVFVFLMLCSLTTASLVAIGRSGALPASGGTVAVIPMDGTIAGVGTGANSITPEGFLKLIKRAEDDDSVKAIVLRVNSPGGTVAASEEIATYVKNATKPVVVSVGDMDASGAYMVSSQADKIVANPGSAVGSIGVILEVPDASGLLDKIGVSFKVITAGKYKDAGSPYRALTATETAMLQGQVDQVYEQFVDIVAEGRNLPRSEVASLATGWAWNGEEAKRLHLVDQLGTYQDALKTAARLGKIKGEYRTVVYSDTSQLSSLLSALLGIESQLKAIGAVAPGIPASSGGTTLAK